MGTPVVYNQFKLKQHNGNAIINIITSSVNYVGRTVDVVVGAVKALISRVALSLSISL